MRKLLLFIMVNMLIVSCKDDVNLSSVGDEGRLNIYAFVSTKDTIQIDVSATRSISGKNIQLDLVTVTSITNGHADNVQFECRDTVNGIIREKYLAIGKHGEGERVDIKVCDRKGVVAYASTEIPHVASIEVCNMDTVFYKGKDYYLFSVELTDTKQTDYYAVRITGRYTSDDKSIVTQYQEIETSAEPLLNNYSNTDMDFGNYNNFYHKMYIFNDEMINGRKIKLRLYVLQQFWFEAYKVELFTLSREYFLKLKSLNDIQNNSLGEYGLSFLSTSYTNVTNGIGCVGAYNKNETRWMSTR